MQGSITAQELLDQARADLTEVERAIREHPFLDALESGRAPRSVLEALAGERPPQLRAARDALPGRSRRGVLPVDGEGEGLALGLLQDFATAVGVGPDWLAAYEPSPDCQAYPALVAWLALNGSSTDVAHAFLANLSAWGACLCALSCSTKMPRARSRWRRLRTAASQDIPRGRFSRSARRWRLPAAPAPAS